MIVESLKTILSGTGNHVKIISKCGCYALKVPLPHYKSRSREQN